MAEIPGWFSLYLLRSAKPVPMNASAPDPGYAAHDWLSALPPATGAGEGDGLCHAILLERCFDGRAMRWSDALVARTRRHIGGCLAAVEMKLRLELGMAVEAPVSWERVRRDPALLGPALLRHMRDRAGLGLMGQDLALADAPQDDAADATLFSPSARQALAALALGQSGWADAMPDEVPMRTDLPAEAMAELVWTVGALVADAMIEAGAPPALATRIDHACSALLARHDEQHMPFAQAALFAHQMRAAGVGDAHLLYLSRHRHILALLALAADRLGADLPTLAHHALEGTEQALFSLCRAAEFPREVAVRLVLGRRSVARGVDDSVLIRYADDYDGMTSAEARDGLVVLGLSQPLRAGLAQVRARARRAVHDV